MDSHPCQTKSAQETQRSLKKSCRSGESWGSIWYRQFSALCESLPVAGLESGVENDAKIRKTWKCRTDCATSDRRISSVLVQSGLQELHGEEDMECDFRFRNVQDVRGDDQTHFKNGSFRNLIGRLFRMEQKSLSFPYIPKTKVECMSSAPKFFLEFSLHSARSWNDDFLLVDTEDLKLANKKKWKCL